MLPRPFARIVIGIGKPLHVNREDAQDEFAAVCVEMNLRLNEISAACSKKTELTS
jgi:lysophospholipid acyltransferase (LPLAT)-like uncharacterized protein